MAAKTTKTTKKTVKKAEKPTKKEESPSKTSSVSADIIVEACKSWGAFKSRSAKVDKAGSAAGLKVAINNEKPRKGAFVITVKGKKIIELLDMARPFTKLKALDMDEVIANVIKAAK